MKYRSKKPRIKLLWLTLIIIISLGLAGCSLPGNDDSKDVAKDATQSAQTDAADIEEDTTEEPEEDSLSNEDDSSEKDNVPAEEEPGEDDLLTGDDDTLTEDESQDEEAGVSDFTGESTEPLSISMLDVGQGLSLLIGAGGHYMLYDGGGRKSSSFVVSYLKKHDITELDYIIASHYDEDHISGLNGVLNTTTVDTALIPDYSSSTQTYESFIRRIKLTETDYKYPEVGQTYSLGNAEFEIIGPDSYKHDDDNDSSIAIRLTYGSTSCIIAGDTSEAGERKMISSKVISPSDLYVVSHHGSDTASSNAFVKAVSPKYAFISVGKDNTYGHPSKRVLKTLKKNNVKIFRTDVQKTVTAVSDGESWEFDKDPCTDWSAGKKAKKTKAAPAAVKKSKKEKTTKAKKVSKKKVSKKKTTKHKATKKKTTKKKAVKKKTHKKKSVHKYTYVLNIHTKVFHYPDCRSVSMMKDSNKEIRKTTHDALEREGYRACGNCCP